MAPRPNIAETVQIGAETTAGTAVAANRRLGSLAVDVSYDISATSGKPTGYKYATTAYTTTDAAKIKVSGTPTYTEAPYPLSSVIGKVTPTTPNGGTISRDWTFASGTTTPDTPQTFSVEQGSNAHRCSSTKYMLLSELGLTFSRRQGLEWSGSGIAQRLHDDKLYYLVVVATGGTYMLTVGASTTAVAYDATAVALQAAIKSLPSVGEGNVTVSGGPGSPHPYRILFGGELSNTSVGTVSASGINLTGTTTSATLTRISPSPTEYTLVPILGKQLDLYIADTYAGLDDASRMTAGFSGSWKIGNRFEASYFINSISESWADAVEQDPSGEMTLTVSADDVGMGLLNNLRTSNTLFVQLVAIGPLIEGTLYHTFMIEQALKVTKISDKKVENSVVAYDFSGEFAHDATWGKSFEITVRNTLTEL